FLDKYLQIIYALIIAQELVDFCHYDLHDENVLIRQMGSALSIPYTNELGVVEYLNTDGISTIIDYGFSHLKLEDGSNIGITDFLSVVDRTTGLPIGGVYPDRTVPLFDVYKLLMFSLMTMAQNKNFECLQKCVRLYQFFSSEDLNVSLQTQRVYYYNSPLNEKTVKVGPIQFLNYIRKNIPEFSQIVTAVPRYSRVLGCTGNDVCITEGAVAEVLGFNKPLKLNNVLDFFDLVSRFENEGRTKDIEEILSKFDFNTAVSSAIKEYNNLIVSLDQYFPNNTYPMYDINLVADNLNNKDVIEEYKDFLIETAKVYESFQRVALYHDAIVFTENYYNAYNLNDLEANYSNILTLYRDFEMVLMELK